MTVPAPRRAGPRLLSPLRTGIAALLLIGLFIVALAPSQRRTEVDRRQRRILSRRLRRVFANAARAQILLSIHFNSYEDPSVGGSETLYDDARPFTSDNLRFAQVVQREALSHLAADGWHIPDRGVIPDSEAGTPALTQQGTAYGRLLELGPAQSGWLDQPSQMPGALAEMPRESEV